MGRLIPQYECIYRTSFILLSLARMTIADDSNVLVKSVRSNENISFSVRIKTPSPSIKEPLTRKDAPDTASISVHITTKKSEIINTPSFPQK